MLTTQPVDRTVTNGIIWRQPQSPRDMPVDPEEGLVTDLMLGMLVVFGIDIIALVGFMWLTDYASTATFVATTGLVVGGFVSWIGWRWRELRKLEAPDEPERSALDELKHRYAAGEIGEAEFERKLDRLVEIEDLTERPDVDSEELVADDLAAERSE